MHLKFSWPQMAGITFPENVYFGGWHPTESLTVEWSTSPSGMDMICLQADNWFLTSTRSSLHVEKPGLIHAKNDALGNPIDAVAFRGYILVPPIHSYSSSQTILSYWLSDNVYNYEHNGIFSGTCIQKSGNTLTLITDAFGMAPLYYRNFGGTILFSTNPRYLSGSDDKPDYMAWRCFIQTGFIAADRTLTTAIKRVPAGQILRFQDAKNSVETYTWFDHGKLPEGTKRIDTKAIANVEESFQSALSRCLKLKGEHVFLPLSSGYDSRRILASLIERKISFDSTTVRIFQKQSRDLDAHFAAIMAKDFGFSHRVIEARNMQEHVLHDYQRRILLDIESYDHSWALALMHSLPHYPTIFIDGLAGDALGETGFDKIPGLHIDPANDKFIIARHAITNDFDKILHSDQWPSANDIRRELITYIETLGEGMNQAELAFLLLRTRRSIAIWAQHMLPAGHLVVCPYLDLEYVKTLLSYHPTDKLRKSFQMLCLKQYWPHYFSYPGSRAIPLDMPSDNRVLEDARKFACLQKIQQEIREKNGISQLTSLLNTKAAIRFWIAQNNKRMALITMWAFRGLMEIMAREVQKIVCWEIDQER